MRNSGGAASAADLAQGREDPLLVEQADAAAVPREDRLAEPNGRVGEGRGDGPPLVARDAADARDLVGAEGPGLGAAAVAEDDQARRRAWGFDAEQAVERDAGLR